MKAYIAYIIPKLDDSEKSEVAQKMYELLEENNIHVLYDDRADLSIGAKIRDSKIVGTPYVVVFGKTLEKGCIEVENNKTGEKIELKPEELVEFFSKLK